MNRNFQDRVSATFGGLNHSLKERNDSFSLKSSPEEIKHIRSVRFSDEKSVQPTSSSRPRSRHAGTKHKISAKIPDHVKHPSKWTKYSIEEDGSEKFAELTSDQVNSRTALLFINHMKSQCSSATGTSSTLQKDNTLQEMLTHTRECSPDAQQISSDKLKNDDTAVHCIKFARKSSKVNSDTFNDITPKGKFTHGIYKMPEYVIGSEVKSHSKATAINTKRTVPRSCVQLDHLKEQ